MASTCLGPEETDLTLLSYNHSYYTNRSWKIPLLFVGTPISLSLDGVGLA